MGLDDETIFLKSSFSYMLDILTKEAWLWGSPVHNPVQDSPSWPQWQLMGTQAEYTYVYRVYDFSKPAHSFSK